MIATDAALVTAAAAGDRDAFTAIHERHVDAVHDHLVRWCRDAALAADGTQEAFVSLLHNLDSIRDGQAVRAWLMRTGRNRVVDQLLRTRRERTTAFDDRGVPGGVLVVDHDPDAAPAVAAERAEAAALVWQVAQGLDRRTFSVLDLHVRQGLSGSDLAEALGTSRGNADVLVHRMKQRMRTLFGAVLLLPAARDECAELRLIVDRVGEPLELSGAREVEAHAQDCPTCEPRRRRAVAPLRAYGALAQVRAPMTVRMAITAAADQTFGSAVGTDQHDPSGAGRGRRAALVGAATVLLLIAGATPFLDLSAPREAGVGGADDGGTTETVPSPGDTGVDGATGAPGDVDPGRGSAPASPDDDVTAVTDRSPGAADDGTGEPSAPPSPEPQPSDTAADDPTSASPDPSEESPDAGDPTRSPDASPTTEPTRTPTDPSPSPTVSPAPTFTFSPSPAPTFTFSPSPVPTFTFSPAPVPQPIP